MKVEARQRFLDDYLRIRRAEGRGSDDPAYYLALPYQDLSGKLAAQWAMRGRTYRYFEQRILPAIEREAPQKLDVLDLGAGTGWLSYRLALRGHRPVAVDILTDARDGLGAARHYFDKLDRTFPTIDAEFDDLPLPDARFDVAIYNVALFMRLFANARRSTPMPAAGRSRDCARFTGLRATRTWRNDAPRAPAAISCAVRNGIRPNPQHRIFGSGHHRLARARNRRRVVHSQTLVRIRLAHAIDPGANQGRPPAIAILDS
jgi:SAM-dependent methyltransferase